MCRCKENNIPSIIEHCAVFTTIWWDLITLEKLKLGHEV